MWKSPEYSIFINRLFVRSDVLKKNVNSKFEVNSNLHWWKIKGKLVIIYPATCKNAQKLAKK